MTDKAPFTDADRLVFHLVRRMLADGRVAYFFGPPSEMFRLLTVALAVHEGRPAEDIGRDLWARCRPETVRTARETWMGLEAHIDRETVGYLDEYVSPEAAREIVNRALLALEATDHG